jgi:glycosyltransferase 2 family protein
VLIWWRGPEWHVVGAAFDSVGWPWVVLAVGLNLVSVLARALAWNTVIRQAIEPPRPAFRLVFSAFCVGLFANAVLPGRVGEIGRVAVLARRLPRRRGLWATLIGTVVAHRMFDLFPAIALVVWVLSAADVPHWALMTLAVVLGLGLAAFALALLAARRNHSLALEGLGRVRLLLAEARRGLTVLRTPLAAGAAVSFQLLGWLCQLLAVWAAMNAFHIREPIAAAGLVLLLVNVISVFPFWPGNVGLVQAGIAVSLAQYGVGYSLGFAFGIGLQAIEASVGIGIGTLFLAREGLSYGMLKEIEPEQGREDEPAHHGPIEELSSAGARLPG